MAGYTRCPDCEGSIPSYTGICADCGFDLAEFCNGFEEPRCTPYEQPPLEAYADAVNVPEHLFEHEDHFYDHGDVA